MSVFELIGYSAWVVGVGGEHRIGMFSTYDKAEAKIKEIRKQKSWKDSWTSFNIHEVEVK
jgi:hypothetical protein